MLGEDTQHRRGDVDAFVGCDEQAAILGEAQVTLLADRRTTPPWGLAGGDPGEKGNTSLIVNGEEQSLPGKCTHELKSGTRIRIESPGGGGWGKHSKPTAKAKS